MGGCRCRDGRDIDTATPLRADWLAEKKRALHNLSGTLQMPRATKTEDLSSQIEMPFVEEDWTKADELSWMTLECGVVKTGHHDGFL